MRYMCVKTIKAVTDMRVRLFNKWSPSYTHGPVWQLFGKQTSGENTAGLHWHEQHGPLATLQCTCRLHSPCAAASLPRSLLLSGDERNLASVLSASRRADRRNDDYVTMFHLACRLWRAHSHALLMQTMQLCGLLNARLRGTMTNRIANAKKLNSNSNL